MNKYGKTDKTDKKQNRNIVNNVEKTVSLERLTVL